MAENYLHGHMLTPYSTDHKLAAIEASLVELHHKIDVLTAIAGGQAEFQRQAALQLKVLDIQIGLLRERLPKADG